MSELECTYCETKFPSYETLAEHMKAENHCNVKKDSHFWTNPQYAFSRHSHPSSELPLIPLLSQHHTHRYLMPIKESDSLLMGFEQDSDEDDDSDEEDQGFMEGVYVEAEEQAKFV